MVDWLYVDRIPVFCLGFTSWSSLRRKPHDNKCSYLVAEQLLFNQWLVKTSTSVLSNMWEHLEARVLADSFWHKAQIGTPRPACSLARGSSLAVARILGCYRSARVCVALWRHPRKRNALHKAQSTKSRPPGADRTAGRGCDFFSFPASKFPRLSLVL